LQSSSCGQAADFARHTTNVAGLPADRGLLSFATGMRIEVHAGTRFDDQTRAYAEYRLFSRLIAFADIVEAIGVSLTRSADAAPASSSQVFACRVSIALRSGRRMGVASHAPHPYEAIDRAAHQIANVLSARAEVAAAPVSGR
jgi:hypothetical protein